MELLDKAQRWADHDPDPATASSLKADIEAAERGDEEALARVGAAMNGPLEFGTAGLRGVVGPGESRMNLAVVIRATAGLCQVVKAHATGTPTLVVGCDARYGSSEFATAACRVASAAGVRVLALPQANPTPLTSFAVRHYGADAGVMVTASHNPAPDNGYKVYLGGSVVTGDGQGVQIVPPFDAEIAAAIEAAPPADEIPMNDDLVEAVDPREEYVAEAVTLVSGDEAARADLRIVLTAMHGVGAAMTARVLAEAGFAKVSLVAAQAEPDPDFPTVPFPNPEEAGALDMAIEQARAEDADLIIAVDPDADRCALAVPDPHAEAEWTPLSGDQIGCLLGEFLASRGLRGSLANSIVSSRLLARIARSHGLEHHTTLTGFKWIARAPQLAFGYEEAIGFCPNPSAARDKDGIASSVVAASLFAALKTEGRTAWDELDRLAHAHGLHVTGPLTFRVEEIAQIATGMARLRAQPPSELAGSPVVEVSDLAEGYQGLPPTDGILVLTEAGDRVIARPSGTEPKLKCYLEVILPAPEGEPVPWGAARERLELIKREFGQIIGL